MKKTSKKQQGETLISVFNYMDEGAAAHILVMLKKSSEFKTTLWERFQKSVKGKADEADFNKTLDEMVRLGWISNIQGRFYAITEEGMAVDPDTSNEAVKQAREQVDTEMMQQHHDVRALSRKLRVFGHLDRPDIKTASMAELIEHTGLSMPEISTVLSTAIATEFVSTVDVLHPHPHQRYKLTEEGSVNLHYGRSRIIRMANIEGVAHFTEYGQLELAEPHINATLEERPAADAEAVKKLMMEIDSTMLEPSFNGLLDSRATAESWKQPSVAAARILYRALQNAAQSVLIQLAKGEVEPFQTVHLDEPEPRDTVTFPLETVRISIEREALEAQSVRQQLANVAAYLGTVPPIRDIRRLLAQVSKILGPGFTCGTGSSHIWVNHHLFADRIATITGRPE